MRASDSRRDATAARLRSAYSEGALSTSTFELRLGRALTARSAQHLERLTADLPSLWNRARHRWAMLRNGAAELWGRLEGEFDVPVYDIVLPQRRDDRLIVGREDRCDFVIDDRSVSRSHLEIRAERGLWYCRDLRSTNGTYVQGRRVRDVQVREGDFLLLGKSWVRLVTAESGSVR